MEVRGSTLHVEMASKVPDKVHLTGINVALCPTQTAQMRIYVRAHGNLQMLVHLGPGSEVLARRLAP